MKVNLGEKYPEIFGTKVVAIELALAHARYLNALAELERVKDNAVISIANKILDAVTDSDFKKLLSADTINRESKLPSWQLINHMVDAHMVDNNYEYTKARACSQGHVIRKFDGFEKLLDHPFELPEMNAKIWFIEKPHDAEYLLVFVGEI